MPEHIHVFVGEGNLARYRLESWVCGLEVLCFSALARGQRKAHLAAKLLGSASPKR